MRKTDQELMWEVFMEASNGGVITTGGPLKAGGGSSAPKSSDEDEDDVDGDSYEDEEGKDKLKAVLYSTKTVSRLSCTAQKPSLSTKTISKLL